MTQLGLGLRRFVFTRDSVSSPVRAHTCISVKLKLLSQFFLSIFILLYFILLFFSAIDNLETQTSQTWIHSIYNNFNL